MVLPKNIQNNKLIMYCLVAALVIAGLIGLNRLWLEIRNMKVEMVMGFNDVRKLQNYTNLPYDQLFSELKAAGIIAIALEEDTLSSLRANGDVAVYKGEDILNMARLGQVQNYALAVNTRQARIKPGFLYVIFDDADAYNRARDSMVEVLGTKAVAEMGGYILEIRGDIPNVDAIGLGISQKNFQLVRTYGFYVIPHLVNRIPMKEDLFAQKLARFENVEGVNTIIFSGNGGIEYTGGVALIANRFKQLKLNLGVLEFDSKKGTGPITREIPDQTIGVHFISDASMRTMTPAMVIGRYVMAVAERGMRILYVRPFFHAPDGADLLPYNTQYIDLLQKTLAARHFTNQPIEEPIFGSLIFSPNIIFVLILALGVAASLLIFLTLFYELSQESINMMFALFALGTALAFMTDRLLLWRSLLALIVTMIYPVYALIVSVPDQIKDEVDDPLRWKFGVKVLFNMSCIILVGALLIVGILSDAHYMLKIEQFAGVKLAFMFPVFFTVWYYLLYPDRARALRFIVRRMLQTPLSLGTIVLGGIIGIVAVIYVGRSGNFTLPIFAGEDIFRQILNTVFFVRPRTKEFLIGYPLFLVFISYWGNRLTVQWRWLFLAFVVVAPVSLLNTFCHIHAPLLLSLLRSVNGFVVGIALGFVYIVGVRAMTKAWKFLTY